MFIGTDWNSELADMGLERQRRPDIRHDVVEVPRQQDGRIQVPLCYHHRRLTTYVKRVPLNETDLIHPRHPVRHCQLTHLPAQIILNLHFDPPVYLLDQHLPTYVLPFNPHHRPQLTTMGSHVCDWCLDVLDGVVCGETDAEGKGVDCDGGCQWDCGGWDVGIYGDDGLCWGGACAVWGCFHCQEGVSRFGVLIDGERKREKKRNQY